MKILVILTLAILLSGCMHSYDYTKYTIISYPEINETIGSKETVYFASVWDRAFSITTRYENKSKYTEIYYDMEPEYVLYEFYHKDKTLHVTHYSNGSWKTNIAKLSIESNTTRRGN
jgi:hypothetical protein